MLHTLPRTTTRPGPRGTKQTNPRPPPYGDRNLTCRRGTAVSEIAAPRLSRRGSSDASAAVSNFSFVYRDSARGRGAREWAKVAVGTCARVGTERHRRFRRVVWE